VSQSSAFYALYIAAFLKPSSGLLLGASALLGVAAACLWTAQGAFITACSNDENRGRNSGIFWAMLQSSLLTGNLIGYFQFPDPGVITVDQAHLFYWILFGVAAAGVVILCLLRAPVADLSAQSFSSVNESTASTLSNGAKLSPLGVAKATFQLLITPKMLQLSVIIMYSGLILTFWSSKCVSAHPPTSGSPPVRFGCTPALLPARSPCGLPPRSTAQPTHPRIKQEGLARQS